MTETLVIENQLGSPQHVRVRYLFASDFADIFEVRSSAGALAATAPYLSRENSTMIGRTSYEEGDFKRATRIEFSEKGDDGPGFVVFGIDLEPGEQWELAAEVVPEMQSLPFAPVSSSLRGTCPELRSSIEGLENLYRQSVMDLDALTFSPGGDASQIACAAGSPWFMALFGRDSILTAYQALPFFPQLARGTLLSLAAHQATELDEYREAQPGKILHELRVGKLASLGRIPHTPYYGSHDATLLFLILVDEYERWTGDASLVMELEKPAFAALEWMETCGDIDGDGYLEHETRRGAVLTNQGWKDSAEAMAFADGTMAKGPVAVCEFQGYAYDARLRMARLCREVWGRADRAQGLEADALRLKTAFNRDFWSASRGHYVLALDGHKRQVDSLTSNIGHLLWSGIVDDARAGQTVSSLSSEQMFSGWGIRTMAKGDGAYNPLGYHTGSVWPHDSAIAAEGMRRYGFADEASDVVGALLEAAPHFDYRLPEVFGGYARADTEVPVAHPTSCRPQAWAAGAVLLMLRTLLGLEPGGEPPREPVVWEEAELSLSCLSERGRTKGPC